MILTRIESIAIAAIFGFFAAPAFGATENSPRAHVTVENWDKGGALSHWVYTHVSEVFPSAVIRRGGAILDLLVQIRPEIGALKLKNPDGSELFCRLRRSARIGRARYAAAHLRMGHDQ